MPRENNYLLGYGERLSTTVEIAKRSGPKNPPYDFEVAQQQVSSWLDLATEHFKKLPYAACPNDQVTAVITMHPRYVSKSDFPRELLEEVGLKVVGGRLKKVQPKNWGVIRHPEEALTDELIVMGSRRNIFKWKSEILDWTEAHHGASHLTHLEDLQALKSEDKIKYIPENRDEFLLEVVLHDSSDSTIEWFNSYAKACDSRVVFDRMRNAEGLTFIPVYTSKQHVQQLADFSFVRVMRGMPTMRPLTPVPLKKDVFFPVKLPADNALDTSIRAAIFDGGIPTDSILMPWVNVIEPAGIGAPVNSYLEHGLAVTSSFLFGPLESEHEASRPFCHVDHIRVLDDKTGSNQDFEYYDALDRIIDTIDNAEKPYDFINLSIGPNIPVNDDEVTRWTASLDERFAGGNTLATIAAGNSGYLDALSGLNRIQPPSDAVNALCVGACDNINLADWNKTGYSCIGPGRCPGIVKPDGVAFGGNADNPFMVLATSKNPIAQGTQGTSFAAPYALRSAVSVRAHLGEVMNPLAIRALLVHRAVDGRNHQFDVGWGRFEMDYERLITCDDDEVLVAYQGVLPIKNYLRVLIPMPSEKINGKLSVSATLVIAPEVDPGFPNVYTRGGLEVAFRPNSTKFTPDNEGNIPSNADTVSFFSSSNIYRTAEYNLRGEGHKWEPCLKATRNFLSKSLNEPCFDIYYHKRHEGINHKEPKAMPYAFIVSVKAPRVHDYYEKVVRAYSNILIPLQPSVRIQIRK